MIDLPMSDIEKFDPHPKIILYNRLLLATNIFAFVFLILRGVPILVNFGVHFLSSLVLLAFITVVADLLFAFIIERRDASKISMVTKYYLVPVILDMYFILFAGLGIIRIFFRIVIYQTLNPDALYYDDEDPLFTD
ncbi:MAG: hypothetical protein ACXAE3_13435 [Candidatus Kariarchaeaceae archaeon]|jgi:hypothetical protein